MKLLWQPDPTAPVSAESLRDKSFELIAGRDVRPVWLSDLAAAEVFAAIQSPMNDEYQSEFVPLKVALLQERCRREGDKLFRSLLSDLSSPRIQLHQLKSDKNSTAPQNRLELLKNVTRSQK